MKLEPVEVTARFDMQGQAQPLSFTLHGRNYVIDTTGRQWKDERGEHFLVMVPLERVFELLFVPAEGRWYLLRTGLNRRLG